MALLFADSFDHYVTADVLKKYSAQTGGALVIGVTGGRRNGGYGYSLVSETYGLLKSLPTVSGSTIIVGTAYKSTTQGTDGGNYQYPITVTGADGYNQVYLVSTQGGAIRACRPLANAQWSVCTANNILGTSAGNVVPLAAWCYIEAKFYLHGSAGTVDVRVNGVSVLSLSGLNTAPTSTGVGGVAFCGLGNWDDIYICDTSGATNNDFLGDVRVECHFPTADGTTSGWTPSTSTVHYSLVDEVTPSTTDYNSTSTLNAIDTLGLENLKHAGSTILGVQTDLHVTKLDVGACGIAPVIRIDGTDNVNASPYAPSLSSWLYASHVYDKQPDTTAWNETDFNAMEVGYKKTA